MYINIIRNLSWNVSIEEQEKAMAYLASLDNLEPRTLLQPLTKDCWENAAKVLYLLGYPRMKESIPGLFIWLQDKNWPGVMVVNEILKLIPINILCQELEAASNEAITTQDEIWLYNLSEILTSFKLNESDFVSKEIYYALLNAEE